MKLLLDAQLSYLIADVLRERGHDADAVTSRPDLSGNTPDEVLMTVAHAEGRVIVTSNIKDFRPIAAQRIASGHGHSGLILVPSSVARTRASVKALADAIEQQVEADPAGLADSERWI